MAGTRKVRAVTKNQVDRTTSQGAGIEVGRTLNREGHLQIKENVSCGILSRASCKRIEKACKVRAGEACKVGTRIRDGSYANESANDRVPCVINNELGASCIDVGHRDGSAQGGANHGESYSCMLQFH